MSNQKVAGQGLAYDDVLLIPGYSEILPREVDLRTRLTREVELNTPLVSAAMDTITETEMAMALAREGGIGILHKNLSIERQVEMVEQVKRSESGIISEPFTLRPEQTVKDAQALMRKYRVSGIPITDGSGKLAGIVTNRDLRFQTEGSKRLEEIMTKKLVTAPVGIGLDEAQKILHTHKIEKLLIVDGDFMLKGLITFKDIEKRKSFPGASKDEKGRLRVGAAVGVATDTLERVEKLIKAGVDVITVDTAHGHAKKVLDRIREIRQAWPKLQIISGNVATPEAAEASIKAGVDAVKVGVGPGSICTTRIIAGVGVPQLSAVMNCAEICMKYDVPLIADGGIRFTGDVAKAIAGGASTVMLGNMLAGLEESPGKTIIYNGRKYKIYRGMGSLGAMAEGTRDRYFQDAEENLAKLVPEGIEGRVPYRGYVREIVYQITGGLRAAMGYCGTPTIKDLQTNGKFTQVTQAGIAESHPHDIDITEQSPNYWR
ncbi:MAG: IMP dehydrogenase [Candidatus Liptonbacteria bacterium]|nr:IMP dehydrogenase [Candidatus Liptonbacteria bacterium]